MNFVLVRPNDDKDNKDIVELFAVQHPTKKITTFQTQWDRARARAIFQRPETWNVNDVFHTLEEQGWTIMKLDPINVEY